MPAPREEVRHASRIADSACPFCIGVNAKRGMLSQHFVTRVVPPLRLCLHVFGHAKSAFRDACRTSSETMPACVWAC